MDRAYPEDNVTAVEHSESSPYESYEIRGTLYLLETESKTEIGLFIPEEVYRKTPPFKEKEEAEKVPEKEWREVKPTALKEKWIEVENRKQPVLSNWKEIEKPDKEIENAIRLKLAKEDPIRELGNLMGEIVEREA